MPSTPEVTLPTTKPKISASAIDSPSIAANTPPRSRDPWARMSRVTSHNPPPIRQTMKSGGPHPPAPAVNKACRNTAPPVRIQPLRRGVQWGGRVADAGPHPPADQANHEERRAPRARRRGEQGLQDHVRAVADRALAVREQQREYLVKHQQREGEQEAVARGATHLPVG